MNTGLSRTATLEMILADRQRLESHVWSDHEIRKIPTEDLARLAFRASKSLREQHLGEELFVSFWEGQRRQAGLDVPLSTAPSLDPRIREEWDGAPVLQSQFDNFGAYCAFVRAARAGQIRVLRT